MSAEDVERMALAGYHDSTLKVVEALRRYRAIVVKTLDARYRDGFIDGCVTSQLESEAEEIEQKLTEEE